MPGDESGMSGVGLIMVLIGVWAAMPLVVLADAGEYAVHRNASDRHQLRPGEVP